MIVLPEWLQVSGVQTYLNEVHYKYPFSRWDCWNMNSAHIGNTTIWKQLAAFVDDKTRDRPFKLEIMRQCDRKKIWHGRQEFEEKDALEAYSLREAKGHDVLVLKLMELASEKAKVEVKGAYVAEDGAWKIIEGLPEGILLPVEQAD